MSSVFEFIANKREVVGKSVARSFRRNGLVPAVIYGGEDEPQLLSLNHNEVIKHLNNEAVYSHVLNINIDGKVESAVLKDVQREPAGVKILHLDFFRVNMSQQVRVHVPLHFINEEKSVGVKKGGVATHSLVDVEVSSLPGNLPDYIEVDLAELDVGQSLHLTDLALPEGVSVVALSQGIDHNLPVVSILASRASKEDLAG
ncbi:MAG: 50S ribosomal protein L25/general stress protein Ctc [Methylococcaceae bacterium]|nr:50S ribosomal protein L25/general stress protein Ctc [Methylococcaceae bacterium]MDP2391989.1 50S ribosomal protein L25/general stress protein Ctc [Methylococcaceae bacterium]MDP3020892.1 50S ribosomal protein L25/general stress protein Ctc [Methylococcaceae bacterium]MDP3391106.1 50S ribosomal protein L25/general stress protein Ctc [Methylococcaceae bacterium]MDP3932919.1 50S ribosomal protein L25/general stress protein Ctc [Methylococcaceae bacterium]